MDITEVQKKEVQKKEVKGKELQAKGKELQTNKKIIPIFSCSGPCANCTDKRCYSL